MEAGFAPTLHCPNTLIYGGKIMKSMVIGLALLLLATSVWAGTLRDDFDDGDMDEWEIGSGKWEIKDGELVMTPQGFPVSFFAGKPTWGDYTVRVRAMIKKHQATASGWIEGLFILVREQPLEDPLAAHGNVYLFGLATRGLSDKMAYGTYMQDDLTLRHFVSEPFEWELGKWYDLKLTAEGNQFWFYVDNQLLIHYTDDTYPKGMLGIGASFNGTIVHYDDFSVTGDDVPDMDFGVSLEGKLATKWGKVKR
jgi:hypothetical protein